MTSFGYNTLGFGAFPSRGNPGLGLWVWGTNNAGEMGSGSNSDANNRRSTPTQLGTDVDWFGLAFRNNAAGHVAALKGTPDANGGGELYMWGDNYHGQLGLGDKNSRSVPVQVGSKTDWVSVSMADHITHAIDGDGKLYAWGKDDDNGVFGNSRATDNQSAPVQIGALTNWSKQIAHTHDGDSCIAIKTDGTMWSWGLNNVGQLGTGTVVQRSSPLQIGALTTWSQIAAASQTCLALKTDGTIWVWGKNTYGELGLGLTDANVKKSSPVQIGSDTNWAKISGAQDNFGAIKTTGALYMWGRGTVGEIGQGTVVNVSVPTQVGSDTDWLEVFVASQHVLAIKTNGEMYAWGENRSQGNLGIGTVVSMSVPTQVNIGTDWGPDYALSNTISGGNQTTQALRPEQ